jgi:AcrR family transcriptional regulator
MSRTRIIPDTDVYAALRHIAATQGVAAASFRAVGRATGLAAATLVQRYGTAAGMMRAAMLDGWDEADAALAAIQAPMTPKGAIVLLKALPAIPALSRDAVLLKRAGAWRAAVIKALAPRLGTTEAAAIMFAAWQGRMMWDATGGRGFSLRDATKYLT